MSDLKGTNDEKCALFHYLISLVYIVTMSNKICMWWKFNRITQNLYINMRIPPSYLCNQTMKKGIFPELCKYSEVRYLCKNGKMSCIYICMTI